MFMISMFEKVKILNNGIVGTVVDAYDRRGEKVYIVESDTRSPNGDYELYDCLAEELARSV